MNTPTRRGLLGAVAALPLAAAPAIAVADPNPDAELIRLCDQHIVNVRAYNKDGGKLDVDEYDPLWAAYERTRNAISAAAPQTLAGMLAKARAAKAEARNPDGTEDPEGCPAAGWAWNIVSDLLRLAEVRA